MVDRFAEWMLEHAEAMAVGIAIVAGVVGVVMLLSLLRNGKGDRR